MQHSPGFLKLVDQARSAINELTVEEARTFLNENVDAVLIDVREDREWELEHAENARHLGKGILERDIEAAFPNKETRLVMYCGGGYRSALTAAIALQMGYLNVWSLDGGYKGMKAAGWPMTS